MLHLVFQENKKMYQGSPCKDMYPNEYFPHGITNGAQWYNVPGEVILKSLAVFLSKLMRVQLKEFSLIIHRLCISQPSLLGLGFLL